MKTYNFALLLLTSVCAVAVAQDKQGNTPVTPAPQEKIAVTLPTASQPNASEPKFDELPTLSEDEEIAIPATTPDETEITIDEEALIQEAATPVSQEPVITQEVTPAITELDPAITTTQVVQETVQPEPAEGPSVIEPEAVNLEVTAPAIKEATTNPTPTKIQIKEEAPAPVEKPTPSPAPEVTEV